LLAIWLRHRRSARQDGLDRTPDRSLAARAANERVDSSRRDTERKIEQKKSRGPFPEPREINAE
jgi:hypothetical protein